MDRKIRMLVYGGLFAALVAVATMFIKLPTAIGYVNLGDGFILASALALGPFAAAVGAVGSALADLLLGYASYAPATFVIKGLMGFAAGFLADRTARAFSLRNLLAFLLAEIIMVAGYFIFECFLYSPASALGSVLPNCAQGAIGLLLGLIAVPVLSKIALFKK